MSIDNVTPDEWNTINRELNKDEGNTIALKDEVNHPLHYNNGKVECIDYMKDNMDHMMFMGYLEGNCKKYLHRFRYKQKPLEDLRKARWYLDYLIKEMEGE